jgi:hypothetical protein
MHALRLGYQGVELLTSGRITLPVPEPQREHLRSIGRGEVTLQEVVDAVSAAESELVRLKESSELPDELDRGWVDEWLHRNHLAYGSSGNYLLVSDDSVWPLEALPGIRGVRRRIRLGLTGQRSGWYPPMNPTDRMVVMLVYAQGLPAVGLVARGLLHWRGADIITTDIAPGLHLLHGGVGVVIHGSTSISVNVTVFHNVTIGRRDPWRPWTPGVQRVAIGEDAVLGAGAVILSDSTSSQPLVVGRG